MVDIFLNCTGCVFWAQVSKLFTILRLAIQVRVNMCFSVISLGYFANAAIDRLI